jgi:hypothetical protein
MVEFPIKYLGVPVSVAKLPWSALQLITDHLADKLLMWKGAMMHRKGRLMLVKTTLAVGLLT